MVETTVIITVCSLFLYFCVVEVMATVQAVVVAVTTALTIDGEAAECV